MIQSCKFDNRLKISNAGIQVEYNLKRLKTLMILPLDTKTDGCMAGFNFNLTNILEKTFQEPAPHVNHLQLHLFACFHVDAF